jgi:hypothetical protein
MERASLMYAMRVFDSGGENLHVVLFFEGFMIVLALMLGASVYQLWRSLAAVSGRRRVRF